MPEISAEDREKAYEALREYAHLVGDRAGMAIYALRQAGWAPRGGCVRPTREALARVLWEFERGGALNDTEWSIAAASRVTAIVFKRADALRAADHLWTEQPSDDKAWACAACGGPVSDMDENEARFNALVAAEIESRGLSSAPVVGREALARWYHETQTPSSVDHWDEAAPGWHQEAYEFADALIASGVVRDEATVLREYEERRAPSMRIENIDGENAEAWLAKHDEQVRADQREKDAQIAETEGFGLSDPGDIRADIIAAAIRGGAS